MGGFARCLFTYLHTCLPTCQLANLPICQLVSLHTCTLGHQVLPLAACKLAYLNTCILEYSHTCKLAYLKTCKLAYLQACSSHNCTQEWHCNPKECDSHTQQRTSFYMFNVYVLIHLSLIAVWADTVWTRGKRNMLLTHLPLFSCCLFHQCHCYPRLGGGGCRGICSSCKWRWNITDAPLSISSHLKIRVSSSLESCTFSNRLIVSYPGKV